MAKRIGVLALQGAFAEHETMLSALGAACHELRNRNDLAEKPDGLVLPGGESTVQRKLLMESGMFASIKSWIEEGMPVLATCAGLILLAEKLENDPTVHFGTLPVSVRRNAYGRQLGSFHAEGALLNEAGVAENTPIPTTFIRAPRIVEIRDSVQPLVTLSDGTVAAVRYGNQLACAFHPELDPDPRIHELFLDL